MRGCKYDALNVILSSNINSIHSKQKVHEEDSMKHWKTGKIHNTESGTPTGGHFIGQWAPVFVFQYCIYALLR